MNKLNALIFSIVGLLTCTSAIQAQQTEPSQITYNNNLYYFYPQLYDRLPDIPSPFTAEDGTELIVAVTKTGKYTVIPVAVENGAPLNYKQGQRGKGRQLEVDTTDFPTLARIGLHAEVELDQTKTITGKSIGEITEIGRPEMSSGAGFMGQNEDIISVLKGDNRLVRKLGLTHPQLAKPLFHVWNIIRRLDEESRLRRTPLENIDSFYYNGKKIFLSSGSGHGWQESIFNDEILGMWQLEMWRILDEQEVKFLSAKFPGLNIEQMAKLRKKLSSIHTGEMVPYYIMRYGFYEGHTSYRADPIAISLIFGLQSIEEIENSLAGDLYNALTDHFTRENVSLGE